jgi:lysophospholipid acyltransferase (LPLAT)-like uncharacterized protein
MACASRPFWRLRTWDRLLFPPPLASVHIVLGEPYTVSKETDGDEFEAERQRLENTLNELSAKARDVVKG